MLAAVRLDNPRLTFPPTVIGDEVIVGYQPDFIKLLIHDN